MFMSCLLVISPILIVGSPRARLSPLLSRLQTPPFKGFSVEETMPHGDAFPSDSKGNGLPRSLGNVLAPSSPEQRQMALWLEYLQDEERHPDYAPLEVASGDANVMDSEMQRRQSRADLRKLDFRTQGW